jgi:hypothetical protein
MPPAGAQESACCDFPWWFRTGGSGDTLPSRDASLELIWLSREFMGPPHSSGLWASCCRDQRLTVGACTPLLQIESCSRRTSAAPQEGVAGAAGRKQAR